ncbi:hypothetical protein GUJ93_ZPchr0002g26635 [Zizania palustris]|uniref:Uncharacterized protein n=1 Tax=Zizania palustris TaxID=103762 RepID=A0A8J5SKM9_ZIZPA|nr:hypothetical protein GUJ93_ZPchr0002g26635 [Zizania palustris]
MERWQCHGGKQQQPPALAPPRSVHGERGSFSASLLDVIYRSLDDRDGTGVAGATRLPEEEIEGSAPLQFWWAKDAGAARAKQASGAGRSRREATAVARSRQSGYASSTTSSSDASSCSYSFSCSSASTTDTESTHRRRHGQPPPQQQQQQEVDTDAGADADAPPKSNAKKKKSRPCFPGARLRSRSAVPPPPSSGSLPPSPATFACVVKALFTSSRLPRKPKTPAAAPPPQTSLPVPQPPCMSASATSNTKAPERRSVRFCPDADMETTSVVRRRVEELVLRSLEDVEEDEDGSDWSSDLFELESLRGADRDELPVYGTTNLATNRAIAQGAVC